MAAACRVASKHTHGRADTSDSGDAIFVGSLVELETLDARSDFEDWSIVHRTLVVFDILDLLEAMRPDTQCTFPYRATVVV